MIGVHATTVGAGFTSIAFTLLNRFCVAAVIDLHTVRYVSFVQAVTEFVGHFAWLSWPLAVVAVTVCRP